ncbi:hypothetical protein AXG93_374s1120 [Marchantia polymorpha subsp. ruderalis]|uniref:Integrase catalytic domain-containing protein n=1 Tax=Marchantia polymorpha subsp. ruderalis TaxID=1480154 RepID=A0A176WKA1_MARPO|nr:hypothetical protein AXG93_374s1120 [Marchantia polymorpha subsp. ruderalis]
MGLGKVLKPKLLNVDDEDWNEIQDQAVSIVTVYLKPNVLKQVEELDTVTTMFQALQEKYHMKDLSNRLFTSLKLMSFKIVKGTKIQDHIDAFNDFLVDLLNLGEDLNDEKAALQLLSSLSSSYHTQSRVLLHRDKESITYNEVVIALLTDDIQQKLVYSSTPSPSSTALYVTRGRMEKRSTSISKSQNRSKSREGNKKAMKCWKYGKMGHMKKEVDMRGFHWKAVDEILTVERGSTVIMKAHKRKNLYIMEVSTISGEANATTSLDSKTILEYVYSDVLDPSLVASHSGKEYYVMFIDDYSRYVWIYFLPHKSEVFVTLKKWKAQGETQIGEKVKFLQSDNGGKYGTWFRTEHAVRDEDLLVDDSREALITEDGSPSSYAESQSIPEKLDWDAAMRKEMKSLHDKNTWELVELLNGSRAKDCKWVYTMKYGFIDAVEKIFKVRLVAKGFEHQNCID